MMENSSGRIVWLDVARVAAICFVVMVHTAGPLLGKMDLAGMFQWHVANLFDSAVRSGVPLFIMVSGALLIAKRESVGSFYKRRFVRILLPYIVWSFVYILFRIMYTTSPDEQVTLKKVLFALYTGKVFFHLEFISYFIGIYLFAPFIRMIVFDGKRNEGFYFLAIWFILASFFPMIDRLGGAYLNTEASFFIVAPQFTGLFGFFILGYYVARIETKSIHVPVAGFCLFFLATVFGTFYLSRDFNSYRDEFYRYTSFNVIGMSASVFLLVRNVFSRLQKSIPLSLVRIMKNMSDTSYGVYFIHILALHFLRNGLGDISIHAEAFNPIMAIPLTAMLALILSFLTMHLLCKVPNLKKFIT